MGGRATAYNKESYSLGMLAVNIRTRPASMRRRIPTPTQGTTAASRGVRAPANTGETYCPRRWVQASRYGVNDWLLFNSTTGSDIYTLLYSRRRALYLLQIGPALRQNLPLC